MLPLCACGCGEQVVLSRMHGREGQPNKYVNGHHNRTKKTFEKPDSKAEGTPTAVDLAWIAGFMEGEGSFYARQNGYCTVQAFQVEKEPLLRIKRVLGGRLNLQAREDKQQDIWVWKANGPRARGIMFTMWPMMSAKRRGQIEQALQFRHEELCF